MVKPMEGKEDGGKKMEKPKREIECFNCHQKGHHSSNCPTMLCSAWRDHHTGQSRVTKHQPMEKLGIIKLGSIEGTAVSNILLDNGCSRTLVQKDLVLKEKLI